jgi:hypothetical protein
MAFGKNSWHFELLMSKGFFNSCVKMGRRETHPSTFWKPKFMIYETEIGIGKWKLA